MAYKIKDLMIHLPTEPRFIPLPDNICSGCFRSNINPVLSQFCPDVVRNQATIWQVLTPITLAMTAGSQEDSLAVLSVLKEQLQQQLVEVEREQATIERGLAPKTVEEVDMLTGKLNDALKELKTRRVELAKKPRAARKK
jgi:hypothetical protein